MQILKIVFHVPYRIFFVYLRPALNQWPFRFQNSNSGLRDSVPMTITASGSSEPLAPPPRDGVTLAIATGNRFQRGAPGPGLLGPKVQSGLRLSYGTPAEARPFVPL